MPSQAQRGGSGGADAGEGDQSGSPAQPSAAAARSPVSIVASADMSVRALSVRPSVNSCPRYGLIRNRAVATESSSSTMAMSDLALLFDARRRHLDHFFNHLDMKHAAAFAQALLDAPGAVFFTGVGKSGIVALKLAQTRPCLGFARDGLLPRRRPQRRHRLRLPRARTRAALQVQRLRRVASAPRAPSSSP